MGQAPFGLAFQCLFWVLNCPFPFLFKPLLFWHQNLSLEKRPAKLTDTERVDSSGLHGTATLLRPPAIAKSQTGICVPEMRPLRELPGGSLQGRGGLCGRGVWKLDSQPPTQLLSGGSAPSGLVKKSTA